MGNASRGKTCPQSGAQTVLILGNTGAMGNRIAELRKQARLTQESLATLVKTGKSQIVKLENGDRRLSDHWASRIAPHVGVQPYELFMPTGGDAQRAALRLVPLVGNISCGDWQAAIQQPDGMVPSVVGGPNVFALKASGDSMDQIVNDGGYVFVDPDNRDLHDGGFYAVMNGHHETMAKQYKSNPARLRPCSKNPAHAEIMIGAHPLTVIGRIMGTFSPL